MSKSDHVGAIAGLVFHLSQQLSALLVKLPLLLLVILNLFQDPAPSLFAPAFVPGSPRLLLLCICCFPHLLLLFAFTFAFHFQL